MDRRLKPAALEFGRTIWTTRNSILKKVETGIEDAARAVEDFADKVAAPEEPAVIIPAKDVPPPNPPAGKDG